MNALVAVIAANTAVGLLFLGLAFVAGPHWVLMSAAITALTLPVGAAACLVWLYGTDEDDVRHVHFSTTVALLNV